MKVVWSILKWGAICIAALVAYAFFDGMDDTKQYALVLYCTGFAGFWYVLNQIRDAEDRVNKRIESLMYRVSNLEGRHWREDD